MDLHMPVMDGSEATRAIRAMESNRKQTPILALTADVIPEHREQAFDAGIDEYLVKPIDELQLWSIIYKLVDPNREGESHTRLSSDTQGETSASRDIQAALRIVGGRSALMEKLFSRFLAELPEQMESIRKYRKLRDWPALTKVVHRLHGATAICGVPTMNSLVEALEYAAHSEQENEIARLLNEVEREVQSLLSESASMPRQPEPPA